MSTMSAAIAPTSPPPSSSGGRLVAPDGETLPLVGARLDADAAAGLARVVLRQTFRNPFPDPLRVTYQVPLPPDAAVGGFAFAFAGTRVVGAGDALAFAAWLAGAEARVRASLGSFATRLDVEAVLQETLLRVWQVAPRFEPDGKPDGLVRLAVRIGRNLAISECRRARVAPAATDELARQAESTAVDPVQSDPLLRKAIARCREALTGAPARALAQRLADGGARPDADLAQEIGMTLNTFFQNIRRARQSIETCLESAGIRLAEVLR